MLNLLGFSFNYIDVVCFVAIYCLLATYFGNKLFYASKMQHIEYTYSVICILAITICANPLSSSPTMLSGINQIMLILMLLTFLTLTIKAVTKKQATTTLRSHSDLSYNNIYETTFKFPTPRQTITNNSFEFEQEYENIYSNDKVDEHQNTTKDDIVSNCNAQSSISNDMKSQLTNLQQQIEDIKEDRNDVQTDKTNNISTATQINIIEDKIVILADKIHDMEKQIIEKQQQEINDIQNKLSQQAVANNDQSSQTRSMTDAVYLEQQEQMARQLQEFNDRVSYVEDALQKTIDRITKTFALFKRIIKNYNAQNYE